MFVCVVPWAVFEEAKRFPLFACSLMLHHSTTSGSTVWTDWARTTAFIHRKIGDRRALGAAQQRSVEVLAELDIYQVVFPAGDALSGDVLRAH